MQWVFVGVTTDDLGVQIIFVTGDGSCITPTGILVTETETSVTLASTGTTDKSAKACPARLKSAAGTVRLRTALGSRSLIHAAVSPDWAKPMPLTV